jgi:hypothetical protein
MIAVLITATTIVFAQGSGTVRFRYSGQAVADPRKAELTFAVKGTEVTGRMSAQGIKKSNIRLAGFYLEFKGTLSGPWEDDDTQISAAWSGIDHFEPDQPNDGTLLIFMKDPEMGKKHVHVRVTGRRGQYGWLFDPIRKVYNPQESLGTSVDENDRIDDVRSKKEKQPLILASPSKNYRKWDRVKDQLPENLTMGDREIEVFSGVVYMTVDDDRELYWANWNSHADPSTGIVKNGLPKILEIGMNSMSCFPGNVVKTSRLQNRTVHLKALKKGVAKLILKQEIKVRTPAGNSVWGSGNALYIVVVKAPELPIDVKPDISTAVLGGRVVRKSDRSPVSGARVTMVIQSGPHKGGSYQENDWVTDNRGVFRIEAKNLPSARYEILVHKLRTKGSPGSLSESGTGYGKFAVNEVGIGNDLWPVDQYMVNITADIAGQGPMDMGIILMDKVRNVFPNSGGKNRVPVFVSPSPYGTSSQPRPGGYKTIVGTP